MGTKLSVSIEATTNPEIAPRTDRPPTFDPQYGFAKPRKVREMKATWEEMDQFKLTRGQRDYCAHLLINLMKCQRARAPFAGYFCGEDRAAWDKCEYEDYIMRIKKLLVRFRCVTFRSLSVSAVCLNGDNAKQLWRRKNEIHGEMMCNPQCLRAAQSRLGKKLIEIRNEPTIQGGIFLRHLLLRNPKVGDLYPDVVLSIITSFIEMTLNTSDMASRRLCIDLYSIRYGCDAQMMEILLNTLSASVMNKLLSQEERTGIFNLKSLGVPAMRVHLCNLLFEMFSSSLSFAKAGQFVVRDAIMNILEISLNDLELRDAALGTIRSLCTNGKNSFLPLVPQVVTILISKLKVPSDSLFQTLHHMCRIYGPSSTVFRHLYVIFSSLVHPLDEKV
ncbi:NADH-ubiquinone oxidoreductase B18 subunit [Dictyocaulus viviparus]|uniref:NADH dehydrogenase [ubiquinone] 1 beta subcomplex subunit 7 n=1 Tax=Dictyocaulus viviparus TaxID=29172 RepID=A0A0D8Y1Q4_DICVI|nr:NADH-ubiquinone oxidoreductase B18 subunit [Dictyocaulus viviparus]